jgi:hypothetical protein
MVLCEGHDIGRGPDGTYYKDRFMSSLGSFCPNHAHETLRSAWKDLAEDTFFSKTQTQSIKTHGERMIRLWGDFHMLTIEQCSRIPLLASNAASLEGEDGQRIVKKIKAIQDATTQERPTQAPPTQAPPTQATSGVWCNGGSLI